MDPVKEGMYVYGVSGVHLSPTLQRELVIGETKAFYVVHRGMDWYGYRRKLYKEEAILEPERAIEAWRKKLRDDAEVLENSAKKLRERADTCEFPEEEVK